MSDPFASLDPIQKPKTAAERVLTAAPAYNHAPPPPGAPVAASPFGGSGLGMHMGMGMGGMAPPGGMGMNMNMGGMAPNMDMGGNGMMNMGGMAPPSMGGMGMNLGMGMNPGMGMGMSMGNMGQQQQNPFQQQQQQQPVMYDNIKNLLQQKPKAPAAFEDSASMDFLENLGGGGGLTSTKTNSGSFPASNPQVRAAEPTSAVADPFGGGGFGSSSPVSPSMGSIGGDIGLSIFETGSSSTSAPTTTASPSTAGGTKSSALADRLANGRRKTQEMQRSQLQLNANSFGSVGVSVPKVSLKEMVGQTTSSKSDRTSSGSGMSLDDFSSGRSTSKASSGFGDSDPFSGGHGSSFGSGSVAAAVPRQASFGARQEEDSGSKPVDENDNTFW